MLEASASYGMYNTSYEKNYALYKTTNNAADPNVHVHDGNTIQGSIGYGFNLGKGFLELTGEYIKRDRTNRTVFKGNDSKLVEDARTESYLTDHFQLAVSIQ